MFFKDFLALLHGERHLLPRYFMQTFAFDHDDDAARTLLTLRISVLRPSHLLEFAEAKLRLS